MDELLHVGLGRTGEVLLHPVLADGFAQRLVGGAGAALPARLLFLLAVQRSVKEVEILGSKRLAEQRRRGVDGVPAQVALCGFEAAVGELVLHRGDVAGRADVEGPGRHTDVVQVRLPRKIGAQPGDFGDGHDVVAIVGIAQLHAIHGTPGKLGFDPHHVGGLAMCLLRRIADQREHFDHVVHILRSQLGRAFAGIQVVVAVGERQTTLPCRGNLLRAVFLVLRDTHGEESTGAAAFLAGVIGGQVTQGTQGGDGLELRLERLRAELVDAVGVHAGAKVVAILLLQGRLRRLRRGLQLAVQGVKVVVGKLVEAAPAHLIGGDGVLLHPVAAGVLVEVLTRVGRLIDRGEIEDGWLARGRRGRRCGPRRTLTRREQGLRVQRGSRWGDAKAGSECERRKSRGDAQRGSPSQAGAGGDRRHGRGECRLESRLGG